MLPICTTLQGQDDYEGSTSSAARKTYMAAVHRPAWLTSEQSLGMLQLLSVQMSACQTGTCMLVGHTGPCARYQCTHLDGMCLILARVHAGNIRGTASNVDFLIRARCG